MVGRERIREQGVFYTGEAAGRIGHRSRQGVRPGRVQVQGRLQNRTDT